MSIRPYPNQSKAVDLILDYLYGFNGNPDEGQQAQASLYTGGVVRRTLDNWPDKNILCLTHVQELIQQNFEAMLVGVQMSRRFIRLV